MPDSLHTHVQTHAQSSGGRQERFQNRIGKVRREANATERKVEEKKLQDNMSTRLCCISEAFASYLQQSLVSYLFLLLKHLK